MGTGYTRNDTANNIADGNVINASDLDGEFDAVQAAFNGTTGHSHDGTSGEGPQIDTAGIAADAIDGTKIADNAINSEHYVDGSIDRVHLAADIIDGTKIANDVINSEHYVAGSIDAEHLATDSVTGSKIAAGAVGTSELAADAVTNAKIADNSIDSEHYVDGSIDNAHLASDSVTAIKIADGSVVSAKLGNGAVTTSKILDTAVTTDKIAADAVTTAKIADSVSLGGNPTTTTQTAGNNTTRIATTAFVTTAVNNAEPFPSGTSMLFQQTSAPTGWTKQTSHNNKAIRLTTGTVGTGGSNAFTTALGTPSVAGGSVSGSPGNNQSVSAGNLSVSSGNLATGSGNLAVSISGNIANTTLSTNQIPSHSHTVGPFRAATNSGAPSYIVAFRHLENAGSATKNVTTSNTGASGSHNHGHNLSGSMTGSPSLNGNPSLSGSPTLSGNVTAGNLAVGASTASINVQYVDFIIANKD